MMLIDLDFIYFSKERENRIVFIIGTNVKLDIKLDMLVSESSVDK